MHILVIGSGGREHALCFAIHRSKHVSALFALPGNAGMAEYATCVTGIAVEDAKAIVAFCQEKKIDLVVIGPEASLVSGVVDALTKAGIKAFGPTQKAAQLEASKQFTKDFCSRYHIPTAAYENFDNSEAAKAYLRKQTTYPLVIKADGLAAGKGVVIAANEAEAITAVETMMQGQFGEAGNKLVIEEFLEGEEISFFALCDGNTAIPFASAQDHKRVGEGDTGLNTGGMGTYAPSPLMTLKLTNEVMNKMILPTIKGMQQEGAPFKGVLFAGLMITKEGPKLLEYNVRFGDPETQSIMPLLESDFVELCLATLDGSLSERTVQWKQAVALCVVMAAKGYPGDYHKGSEIRGLESIEKSAEICVFHAGTLRKEGKLLANGGRVLNSVGIGSDFAQARMRAYATLAKIDWPEGFYRHDIGWRVLKPKGE